MIILAAPINLKGPGAILIISVVIIDVLYLF